MDVRMITPLNRANYSKCPKISSYAPTTTQLAHACPTMHCIHLVRTSIAHLQTSKKFFYFSKLSIKNSKSKPHSTHEYFSFDINI